LHVHRNYNKKIFLKKYLKRIKERTSLYLTKGGNMKSIERWREDFANLLNDENRESIIEEMYETGEIYERADNIGIEQEYQNFKKMVNKQIQKRRIKNVARWLCTMRDYRDEIMVLFIEKYLKEEVDKDQGKD
jgi:hypothetical protein